MNKPKNHDTPKCKNCKGRMAFVSGWFHFKADQEPYTTGIIEKAEEGPEEIYLYAHRCDKCGNVQGFNIR